SYTRECDDSDSARKHWSGSFEGSLEVGDAVAVPPLLLALRLIAGTWSRRLPKTGEWTSFPLTKSLGSSETLFYPHWRRTR
ncbi:MAG: hypothetical protein HKN80_05525, partial [Acidimicrobiia bacterium]|nr:hypothetical protein [Acidimicrobiia bacterium]